MHILHLVIDAFNLHSDLNNKCSGLIGGTIYMAIAAATIIITIPPCFAG